MSKSDRRERAAAEQQPDRVGGRRRGDAGRAHRGDRRRAQQLEQRRGDEAAERRPPAHGARRARPRQVARVVRRGRPPADRVRERERRGEDHAAELAAGGGRRVRIERRAEVRVRERSGGDRDEPEREQHARVALERVDRVVPVHRERDLRDQEDRERERIRRRARARRAPARRTRCRSRTSRRRRETPARPGPTLPSRPNARRDTTICGKPKRGPPRDSSPTTAYASALPQTIPSAAPANDVPNSAVVRMPTANVAVSAFAANHSRNRSLGLPCRSRASIASSPCGSTAATLAP